MQHCAPEQLALAALGEQLPADDAAHLPACAACRAEVASLRRAVEALAVPELAAPGTAVPPPPGVWAGIAAATGVGTAPRPEAMAAALPVPLPTAAAAGSTAPGSTAPRSTAAAPAPPAVPPAPPGSAQVLPLRSRRSRLLLAAAACLVVGGAIGAGAVALGTGGEDGAPVAAAALDPLDDSGASGAARVVQRSDGSRALELDLAADTADDAFYEVWLIDEAVQDMYSLGVVQGNGEATLAVPPGVDLAEFPVVDVSVEPLDGDPRHSGVSIARGVLAG